MINQQSLEKTREEIMQVLSKNLPNHQVEEVRQLLATYFAKKATEEFDKLATEKGWDEKTYEAWLNERMRTPYDNQQ
jgi:hypothetical protein